MNYETVDKNGVPFALLPLDALQRLMEDAEMLADIRAFDVAKLRLEKRDDEVIPFAITERRLAGENPLKIWREYRGLTQAKLADISGVSRPMIAAIETGYKQGSLSTLKKLAASLDVDFDVLG